MVCTDQSLYDARREGGRVLVVGEPTGSAASLGATVRRLRLAHRPRMTQTDLADAIGGAMTQGDVSNLERGGVALPRRPRLERIAQIFDLSLGELLALSGWNDADRHLLDDEPGPDPIAEGFVAQVRRVDWSRPGRAVALTHILRGFMAEDAERAAAQSETGTSTGASTDGSPAK